MIKHHPLFYQFTPPTESISSWLRPGLHHVTRFSQTRLSLIPGFRACPEEYLRWITLLESVADAQDSYTMIELELGGTYGTGESNASGRCPCI